MSERDPVSKHERIAAVRARIIADKLRGVETPKWIVELVEDLEMTSNTDRDDLAALIRKGSYAWPYPLLISESEAIADEILAAGYRKVVGDADE